MWYHFFMSDFRAELSARNMALLDHFAERNRRVKRIIPALGKRILLLDLATAPPVDTERFEGYAAQHLEALALTHGISNNCFDIAETAHRAGRASGTMHADSDTGQLIGWDDHCINFDVLGDGTALAVDLTASSNIDWHQGRLDILALRVPNVQELPLRVGQLFGGEWQIDT
jgi:hypothetical protein